MDPWSIDVAIRLFNLFFYFVSDENAATIVRMNGSQLVTLRIVRK